MKNEKTLKSEKILLYSDKQKAAQLDRNVEAVTTGANDLIRIYESFQTFERITTLQDAEELIRNPQERMDAILIRQINPDMIKSARRLNPKSVADLIGIEYDNYLRVLSGETVDPSTCKPCGAAAKVIRGKGAAVSFREYQAYQNYLTFSDRFEINEEAVIEAKKSFDYYISDPAQIELYNWWKNFEKILNEANAKGYMGDFGKLQEMTNGRLGYAPHLDILTIDEFQLRSEIARIKL